MLLERFPDIAEMRVLDLGGTPRYWATAPVKPNKVTVVNLEGFDPVDGVEAIVGDACDPPDIRGDFDLVYSNSLIEHVGGYERRRRLAEIVKGVAQRHWVQTPYRYFPIEPHWLFPGFQFLPLRARAAITQWWPLGHMRGGGQLALDRALSVELLSRTEMRYLFPDSTIVTERFVGLPKSIVAVRG